ncbi:MAG: L-histidine N(alpha)-methyltransferase [Rhodospirillaceae bacterium]|nr:L-histidine N(alpha)-methyltransferase [Rhodospirillaceae bacterium]|tara:strand:+ start:178 stop:1200 length:1023 start_codon:yes stop_codon:yes gene_type:complete
MATTAHHTAEVIDAPEEANEVALTEIPPARPVPSLLDDARNGLLKKPRSIPPKYFYDGVGSQLFDQICDTPEYYPTRTEAALLEVHSDEIVAVARPEEILELGAGTMRKTRFLIDAAAQSGTLTSYAPFDISADALEETGRRIVGDYRSLDLNLLVGDYLAGLDNLPRSDARRLFVFLGGTIGNFEPAAAEAFLAELADHMQPGDHLLIGMDRVKDPAVLTAAYNDAQGVTAAFNLNLLDVLNRELGADFDTGRFFHRAVFNEALSRIEMHLVSRGKQRVHCAALDAAIELEDGETILTEISRKFTDQSIAALMEDTGFAIERHFRPANDYFSLVLAKPR